MNRPKILLVGAQHGDERLGPRLQRFISKNRELYRSVDYICGNPKAYRQNVRFIETDLNRSYDTLPAATYEQKRAQKILSKIADTNYDYILDIHTSRAKVGRFFLTTSLNSAIKDIVKASNIDRVAIMSPEIANCSLIGQVPNVISVEYERGLSETSQAIKEVSEILDNLLNKAALADRQPRQREVFYVNHKIPVGSMLSSKAQNFERTPQGFYPVIFNPTGGSYKTYLGFAANKKEKIVI